MMGFGGNKKKKEEEEAEKAKQEQISQAMRSMSDQLAEKGKKISELEDELEDAKKDAATKSEAEKALIQARAELAKMKGEAARLKADAEARARVAAKVEAKPAPEAAPAAVLGAAPEAAAPARSGLVAGTTAYVRQTGGKNLRLRNGPGLDTVAFAGLPPGTSMTILDGPVEDDGYPWYRVKVIDGREGWVAGTELVTTPE